MTYPPKDYYSSPEETKRTQRVARILAIVLFVALVVGVICLGI